MCIRDSFSGWLRPVRIQQAQADVRQLAMAFLSNLERSRAQRALRRYEELHPTLGPVALACSAAEAV
eukprot:15485249-Alexandrium_andersonii.AAC.1